jgi:hypothetical protein
VNLMRVATALYGLLYFGVGKPGSQHTVSGTQDFHADQVFYPGVLLLLGAYRLLVLMSLEPAAAMEIQIPMEMGLYFILPVQLFFYGVAVCVST